MTDARQDVLTAFLTAVHADGDEAFGVAVRAAAPRVEETANGTAVVLSPTDARARKGLLQDAVRRRLDDAVRHAGAVGWRVDPPRPGA